ncbi:MAG TPA: hypothetical protein VFC44_08145 [Candidatus Saccharimonadales bacterium]|jgi:hypothetical protein|nr:hypothetical protein [Candidatus Saccharimonadales bacterium]
MQPSSKLILQVDKLVERVAPEILVEQRASLELDSHTSDFRMLAQKTQPEFPMRIGVCVEVQRYTDSRLGKPFCTKKGAFTIAQNLKSRYASKEREIGDADFEVEVSESIEDSRQTVLGPEGLKGRIVIHAAKDDAGIVLQAKFLPQRGAVREAGTVAAARKSADNFEKRNGDYVKGKRFRRT